MAALGEYMFRVGFLKISTADFLTGDLGGDCQDRNAAAMAVIKSIDQMQVAWSASPAKRPTVP